MAKTVLLSILDSVIAVLFHRLCRGTIQDVLSLSYMSGICAFRCIGRDRGDSILNVAYSPFTMGRPATERHVSQSGARERKDSWSVWFLPLPDLFAQRQLQGEVC
jgi:hypothetical protein